MIVDDNILFAFNKLTGKNIINFFNNCLSFFNAGYVNITNYYSGTIQTVSSDDFSTFNQLQLDLDNIFEAFHAHSAQMKDSRWWDLLNQIEQIDNRFATLNNINKWARSSATNVAYSPSIQLQYGLQQQQTLEAVARDILNADDWQDSWTDIAINNDLREEDYSSTSLNELQLQLDKTINQKIIVNSVVAALVGKSIYGLDLNQAISFDTSENDLACLDNDDTIAQAAAILIGLKQGDNPDNPENGLQSNVIVGGNRAILNFPIITRQLTATFATDDTFKNFTVESISIDQDNLSVKWKVTTRLDEVIPGLQLLL